MLSKVMDMESKELTCNSLGYLLKNMSVSPGNLTAMWFDTNFLASPSLSFLICKIEKKKKEDGGGGDNKTYSSYVPLEVFGELNEIIINVKIIKNELPKKNSVNNILISLSDSHHQHDFPLVICYLGLKITLSLCLMLYFLIRGLFILNQYLRACWPVY